MKGSKNKKRTVLLIVLIILALVIIWFAIPFSPVISEFKSDVVCLKNGNTFDPNGVFEKSDLEMLPMPLQRYIEGCGYIGTPEMDKACLATFLAESLGYEYDHEYIAYEVASD